MDTLEKDLLSVSETLENLGTYKYIYIITYIYIYIHIHINIL